MTKTVKGILIEARGLIEKGWTAHSYARDADGYPTDKHGPDAVCWCMVGAIEAASGGYSSCHWDAKCAIRGLVPGGDIVSFNDALKRTKDQVLAVFDAAIAAQPYPIMEG